MATDNGHAANQKWALVVTHMLNPNMVQGFPMWGENADAVRAEVEACLGKGLSVPVRNDAGAVILNVILGAGMSYQVEEWVSFEQRMQVMQRQQAEASAAQHLGVQLPPRGPRRI